MVGQGVVTLGAAAAGDEEIALASGDETEIIVLDGTQSTVISAVLSSGVAADADISVEDDEALDLRLTITPAIATEGDGVLVGWSVRQRSLRAR